MNLLQNVCENCREAIFRMEEPYSSSKKGLIYAAFGWLFLAGIDDFFRKKPNSRGYFSILCCHDHYFQHPL
ncbi:hypothetical protein [Neobacillus terrae]|uniref:hypothetical protein n=1 Tax=Neobacillus terrae TaxID=3034837 RepID=UPI00140C8D05|nr:hypothetical protein [Neobacillus terrae]NHM31421.1 hypothetical protein [Neobacillus terrae]